MFRSLKRNLNTISIIMIVTLDIHIYIEGLEPELSMPVSNKWYWEFVTQYNKMDILSARFILR